MDCGLSAGILAAGPDHELTPSDVASPLPSGPETAFLTFYVDGSGDETA